MAKPKKQVRGVWCPTLKRTYRNRRQALEAARANGRGGLEALSVYRCAACRKWHTTKRPQAPADA